MPSTAKFHPLSPRNSLRRLKTAFTPSASSSTTSSTSPLSASRFSNLSFGNTSSLSVSSAFNNTSRRMIRRKKSVVEMEQEEERSLVGDELMSLVEPRPSLGAAYGGIEEVLGGEA